MGWRETCDRFFKLMLSPSIMGGNVDDLDEDADEDRSLLTGGCGWLSLDSPLVVFRGQNLLHSKKFPLIQ